MEQPDRKPFPPILYGTAIRSAQKPAKIRDALIAGYGGIDTACSRKLHDEVADGIALSTYFDQLGGAVRSQLIIQSKYVLPSSQADPWPYKVEDDLRIQVFASIIRSCTDLNLEYIDVYFLSRPLESFEHSCRVWQAMEEVVARGGIRDLGVCHADIEFLERLHHFATTKPRFLQIRFNKMYRDGGALRNFCRVHFIIIEVYGVLWPENLHLLRIGVVIKLANAANIDAREALFMLIIAGASATGLQLCILDGSRDQNHMSKNVQAVSNTHEIPQELLSEFERDLERHYQSYSSG